MRGGSFRPGAGVRTRVTHGPGGVVMCAEMCGGSSIMIACHSPYHVALSRCVVCPCRVAGYGFTCPCVRPHYGLRVIHPVITPAVITVSLHCNYSPPHGITCNLQAQPPPDPRIHSPHSVTGPVKVRCQWYHVARMERSRTDDLKYSVLHEYGCTKQSCSVAIAPLLSGHCGFSAYAKPMPCV